MMNRKPQAQDQNYARKCPKLSQLFFPFFFKFPKNKDEWGHDELPLFPPNVDSPHLYLPLSRVSQASCSVYVCVS